MFIFDWLRKRQEKKERRRAEIREYFEAEMERARKEVERVEQEAKQGPLEPYPSRGNLDDAALNQRERDDSTCGMLINDLQAISNLPPEERESEGRQLERRAIRARLTIRRREIWDEMCKTQFYLEHH